MQKGFPGNNLVMDRGHGEYTFYWNDVEHKCQTNPNQILEEVLFIYAEIRKLLSVEVYTINLHQFLINQENHGI